MHPRIRQLARLALLAIIMVLICQTVAVACPTCKEGLASSDPDRANLVRGYFWSIVFMMSMPFLIFSGLGLYFYLLVRRARAVQSPFGVASAERILAPETVPTAV